MLDQIAAAYLYEEYSDDQDLQAYVSSYNAAQQLIQQWFIDTILPFWPGLQGDLLDWCAAGIYGLPRTSIAGPRTQAIGPLNTQALNTLPALDEMIPSTQQIYQLTDDVFQRILTWHLYRADGRNFTTTWLKRRIMRFLLGVNGLEPLPGLPGFQIGTETTRPISIALAAGTITVTINQILLSNLANITPNILPIFQAAFVGGALELPLQYTYVVNIIAPMTLVILPAMVSSMTVAATQATGAATATITGGSGPFTYLWTLLSAHSSVFDSGSDIVFDSSGNPVFDSNSGGDITITTPAAASTTFSATGLIVGELRTALAQCLVTDTSNGQTAKATCQVSIMRDYPPVLLAHPNVAILGKPGQPILLG